MFEDYESVASKVEDNFSEVYDEYLEALEVDIDDDDLFKDKRWTRRRT